MKRSRIKPSRPKYPSAAARRVRTTWGTLFNKCMVCQRPEYECFGGLDTHEIIRKSQAPNRWCHSTNFLRVCRRCHDEYLCNVTVAPYAVQLAVKKLADPGCFDFEAWLEILNRRGDEAVTAREVELCERAILMGRRG